MEFLVWALPRSRTTWLSKFLSSEGYYCGHDEALWHRNTASILKRLNITKSGSCETTGMEFWRSIREWKPALRLVLVRRPVKDILQSLYNLHLGFEHIPELPRLLARSEAKLEQIACRWPSKQLLVVDYEDINSSAGEIYEFCLGRKFSRQQHRGLIQQNLQTDLAAQMRFASAYKDELAVLQADLRRVAFQSLHLRRPTILASGMEFQDLGFAEFMASGQGLFAQHCHAIAEAPDAWRGKNIGLLQRLSDLGQLHCLTASSNGRMFGYLMYEDKLSEEHTNPIAVATAFYADPSAPMLGVKLARECIQRARASGAAEVFFRAGTRGDGPGITTLMKRLGALPDGALFRIPLGAL